MDIEKIPEHYKQEAYRLIRSIYKFIPYYNKIKGTYIGMHFVLNMMGLCASIVELWSDKKDIKNFSTDTTFYREDEIYATRRFISEVGKADIKDYYLTSRFDIDINYHIGISLSEFNGMANTINDIILAIKPVTRCLRKLFYVLIINTNFHFNYIFQNYGKEVTYDSEDEYYGLKMRTFDYLWYINETPLYINKTKYNKNLKHLDKIFLPFNTLGARYREDAKYTFNNSYFNLVNLDTRLKKSHQLQLQFKIYVRKKSVPGDIKETPELRGKIGDDLIITVENNGISIEFKTLSLKQILNNNNFFPNEPLENLDIFFATHFVMVLGTDYVFQDKGWYDWNIIDLLDEYYSLIGEDTNNFITHFQSEDGTAILVSEDSED